MPQSCEESAEQNGRLVELEERRWLPRHASGDPGAFAELMASYRAPVYGYLVRCGVDERTRDDLFQEIFLKVHGAAARYEPSRPLKPWLFTIVANAVRNHFRRRPADEVAFADGAGAGEKAASPPPDRVIEMKQTLDWLEQAIAALPLAQKEVILLTSVEEMDQASVAAALQIPVNTVKTHLRRARMALGRALARRNTGGA